MDRTPRIVLRVEITPEVRGLLSATSRDFGMTQTATLCRLIEWFSHQPREVRLLATQPWIQGQSPSAARALLETATTREDAPAPGVPHNLPPDSVDNSPVPGEGA